MNKNGRIEIVLGCMWSGKSTELIRQAKRYSSIGKEIMIINHKSDERYGKNIVSTHDCNKITCISVNNLNHIIASAEYQNTEIILIDEAQFFNDLYSFVVSSADNDDKTLIIFGLDGDFEKNPFGDILKLIPHSEKVTKLNALCQICRDETSASFTKRITDEKDVHLVGAESTYMAVCRKHYHSDKTVKKNNYELNSDCSA